MTDKEKLIELLTGKSIDTYADVDFVADYLIANEVVPVVKCEKCVFSKYIEDSGNYKCTTTKGRFGIVKPYDFCSYGDKRCK